MTGDLDEPACERLIKGSALEALGTETLSTLFAVHQVLDVPAGATLYLEEDTPRLTLLIDGLLRVWIASPDGRELTVRHARSGELLGVPTLLIGPAAVRVTAITPARLCYFQADAVRTLAAGDAKFALTLARECAYNCFDLIERMEAMVFGSVRQRLARHLLDVSSELDGRRGAVATAQELASAIGSVRETVARALGDLRREGLIEPHRGALMICNPEALRKLASLR